MLSAYTVSLVLLGISAVCEGETSSGVISAPSIMSGDEADPGQFPYQAGLTLDWVGFCGGALISDTWVLTASQCVDGVSLFTVSLGAHNVLSPKEHGRIVMNTRLAFPHEKFNGNLMDNDVALIKLTRAVVPTERIQIISLPPRSFLTKDFAGVEMRISGWGTTSRFGIPSPVLRYSDIIMMSNEECEETYGIIITDKLICGVDPHARNGCSGDSGGPLVLMHNTKLVHFGILSFVYKQGCASGKPAGYDRTVYFLDWIANKTDIVIKD